jgi:hypothetical protein
LSAGSETPVIPGSVGPAVHVLLRLDSIEDVRATECLTRHFSESGFSPLTLREDQPAVPSCLRKEWWRLILDGLQIPILFHVWSAGGRRVLELTIPQRALRPYGETVTEGFLRLMVNASRAVHACIELEAGIIGAGPYVAGALLDFWDSGSARPTRQTPGTLWPSVGGGLDWIPLESPIDLSYLDDPPGS